jgi:hypothetical protein
MDPWLEGKVVVVTGGSSGIGAATVRALRSHDRSGSSPPISCADGRLNHWFS